MFTRSVNTIFETSGMPVPSEEEVQFEAHEIVQRSGWGLPLIEALRKIQDPYWREAVTRCLLDKWRDLLRDKDEQTYYYDSDGDIRYCWYDAEYDFNRLIRRCTAEQVEYEQALPVPPAPKPLTLAPTGKQTIVQIYIQENKGPIISDSHVYLYQP